MPSKTYDLSSLQSRMWFVNQLDQKDSAYNIRIVTRVRGVLDVGVLQSALDVVVGRHGALRTRFSVVDGEPVQEVVEGLRVGVGVVDLRGGGSSGEREREGIEFATAETRRPFDLSVAPLMRCVVVRLGDEDQLLVFTVHHIVFDGWSASVFFEELSRAYGGGSLGGGAAQFVDVVEWERDSVDGGEQDRLVSWWKEHLAGAPTVLDVVTDRARPAVQAHRGARRRVEVPVDVVEGVEALGRVYGVTLFMTLLSAFGVVLSRHAGQDEVLVGSPVAFRPRSDFEGTIGCLLNTVLMRVDLREGPTFAELLGRTRANSLDAFEHQQVPFERLVAELAPERDLSRNPLYQALFALQNTPNSPLELPGQEVTLLRSTEAHVQSDLCLRLARTEEGLVGALDYDVDLFESGTVDRLVEHFVRVLEHVAREPDVLVSRVDLMGKAERDAVVTGWNDTRIDRLDNRTLPELLNEAARVHRAREAVRCGGEKLTYEQLDHRANALAWRLVESGVGPETIVGVHMRRSVELMIALVAVLKTGGAYLPLEPELPAARLRSMVSDSAAALVITDRDLPTPFLEGLCTEIMVGGEVMTRAPEPSTDPRNLAYTIYTSGSTGEPKGVQIPHGGIVNRLAWMQDAYGLTHEDRVLQKTPIGFDVSVWELFWPLLHGAGVVLAEPGRHRDPNYLVDLISREGVTICHFVPTMLGEFLKAPGAAGLSGLRKIICSGEALNSDVARLCRRTISADVENLYGPTEASVDVTSWPCPPEPTRVSIGSPIANIRTYVLDGLMRPVPVGVPGELYLGGVGLARGYLGKAGLTAERFVPDPYGVVGERLYRTGDRARWLGDGTLEFLGRLDHQVKLRGLRIEPGEVEAVLGDHPDVRHVLVLVREDREDDRRLVAYVVPEGEASETLTDELVSHAAANLPGYMVPSSFVPLDRFPRTVSGKIDRSALPAPDRSAAMVSRPPSTQRETELSRIWEQALGLEGIGAHDDFFDLGGDSMHAITVVGRASLLGFDFSVDDLFRSPTVASLAGELSRKDTSHEGSEPEAAPFALLSEEDRAKLNRT